MTLRVNCKADGWKRFIIGLVGLVDVTGMFRARRIDLLPYLLGFLQLENVEIHKETSSITSVRLPETSSQWSDVLIAAYYCHTTHQIYSAAVNHTINLHFLDLENYLHSQKYRHCESIYRSNQPGLTAEIPNAIAKPNLTGCHIRIQFANVVKWMIPPPQFYQICLHD